MKFIINQWYRNPSFLTRLLLPLSYLYQLGFYLHRFCYRIGFKKIFSAPVPVVVVGNLTVGGTGKTPFTIALALLLQQQGFRPGIISRGYKGKSANFPCIVTEVADPCLVGDEPVLIAQRTKCPVVVSPKRKDAIEKLLTISDCDIIISDDGLQHHALKKDIEIIIVDAKRQHGNGFCLPVGPLRESVKKISQVDFVVYNNTSDMHPYTVSILPDCPYNLCDPTLKLSLSNCKIHAVAAIGHPACFFATLEQMGFTIVQHAFSDHHLYREEDFSFCKPHDLLIMTEKDAVKCRHFAKSNYWVLPVSARLNPKFVQDFLAAIDALNVRPCHTEQSKGSQETSSICRNML